MVSDVAVSESVVASSSEREAEYGYWSVVV